MASITVSGYEIKIWKRGNPEVFYPVDDFAEGNDLTNFFNTEISSWKYDENDEEIINDIRSKKVVKLMDGTLEISGRTVSGVVQSGDYGYEADIVKSATGKRAHKRLQDEAQLIPFYFHVFVPKNKDRAILAMQRFKNYGAFSIFRRTLRKKFRETFSGYHMDISAVLSKELVDKFIGNGKCNRITFQRLGVSKQVSDNFDKGTTFRSSDGYEEYSIIANRQKALPILSKILKHRAGNIAVDKLMTFQGFEYNRAYVTITLNNNQRKVDLSELGRIGAFYDISDDVVMDSVTGHPTLDSIRKNCKELVNDIYEVVYPPSTDND